MHDPVQYTAVLRGAIVDRTYGRHKNLPGTYLPIFANKIWSYLLLSPIILVQHRLSPDIYDLHDLYDLARGSAWDLGTNGMT